MGYAWSGRRKAVELERLLPEEVNGTMVYGNARTGG